MKKRFPWLTILSDEFDRISTIQFSKSLAGRIKGSKREAAKPSSITNLASPREARYIGRFNLNCLFNPGMFIRLSKFQLKSSAVPDYAVTFQDPIKHSLHVAHRLTDFPGTMPYSSGWIHSRFLPHFLFLLLFPFNSIPCSTLRE